MNQIKEPVKRGPKPRGNRSVTQNELPPDLSVSREAAGDVIFERWLKLSALERGELLRQAVESIQIHNELIQALKPFVALWQDRFYSVNDDTLVYNTTLTVADLKRVVEVLAKVGAKNVE